MNVGKDLIYDIATFLGTDEITCKMYLSILSTPQNRLNLYNLFDNYELRSAFLAERCLISEYVNERKGGEIVAFATDPAYSLSALLLNEAWEVDSQLHTLADIERLPHHKDLNSRYKLLCKVLPELQTLYNNQLPYINELIVVVKGRNKVASGITNLISDAKKSIVAMVSPPQLMGEIVWRAVEERMSNGISYLRISDFDEIKRHGYAIAALETKIGSETLYILQNGVLPEKFYIIDNQKVAFFEKSKNSKKYLNKVQIIKNAGVAEQFYNRFCLIKNSCINFADLLPNMTLFRTRLIKQWMEIYDTGMVLWLEDVFDNGVFYSRSNYSMDFIRFAVSRGLEDGCLSLLDDGNVVINYSLSDILLG